MNKQVLAVLVFMAAATQAVAQQPPKPNVVFILADNVGYGDLGSYGGGELRGAATPRLDALAQEGLRLTQFLVEPACTPSRAALMTGQYSIRNGLSLIAIEGTPYTLPANAFTMGELFKSVGYATAIFGKWHLGSAPQSLPTAHCFDEFYGIPPDISWDAATYPATIALTHSINEPYETLLKTGPQIVEAKAGGPLQTVKPFTEEVRANIDNELVVRSIDFMRRQKAAGKPFLLGQILDTLKELGIDDNTIVVFASDNGPQGQTAREHGNQGTPDMGNSGPLTWIGFSMLRGNSPQARDPSKDDAAEKRSLTPLILFAASPGTITGVITLAVAHAKLALPVTALVAVAVAVVVMWVVMLLVARGGSRANGAGSLLHDMVTRFMGLIVLAMGVQFALTGFHNFFG